MYVEEKGETKADVTKSKMTDISQNTKLAEKYAKQEAKIAGKLEREIRKISGTDIPETASALAFDDKVYFA